VHLPVELSIGGGVPDDLIVEHLDSGLAFSVLVDSGVHISNERVEVILVLLGDGVVLSLIILEPCDNLLFVETEGECVVLGINPV